jgi:hypothetical protein
VRHGERLVRRELIVLRCLLVGGVRCMRKVDAGTCGYTAGDAGPTSTGLTTSFCSLSPETTNTLAPAAPQWGDGAFGQSLL